MPRWADRRRVAVSGVIAALVLAGLAACGSITSSRSSRSSEASVAQALLKPGENPRGQQLTGKRRGGALTAYSSEGFVRLDPGQSYFALDYAVDYATQRPLFSYRPHDASTVSPDLAALMPTTANGGITDGGRTLIVHLRPNVRFSPPVNRAVTSADVAYAIERAANPHVGNPYFAAYFGSDAPAPLEGAQDPGYQGGPIPGIQTPNPSTIVFRMTKPGAAFLIQVLSLPLTAPVPESFAGPLDAHGATTYGTTYLVATGPYMLKSDASGKVAGIGYQTGKSATLVRNPNWNPSTDYRPAYLKQIEIKLGGSPTVIGEEVLTGSDAVELDPPALTIVEQAYESFPAQVTFTTSGAGDHYMALNNSVGPLRNVNVRRAIWAALDRNAIAQADGGPLLAAPMTHFIYPGVSGYGEAGGAAGPLVDYNTSANGSLEVAEKYMRLAGYSTGRYTGRALIQIVAAPNGNGPAVIAIANRAFTSLGFHTHVNQVGQCGVPRREVEACPLVGWVRDFADPQSVLYAPFDGPQRTLPYSANWGQVNDPQINAALMRAAFVNDPTTRWRAWAAVDELLVRQAVAAPETFNNAASIESRDVAGVTAVWNMGIWDLDFTSLK